MYVIWFDISDIKESKELHELLYLVLLAGNYLNAVSTFRRRAIPFQKMVLILMFSGADSIDTCTVFAILYFQ